MGNCLSIVTLEGKYMYTGVMDGMFNGGTWVNKSDFGIDDEKRYVVMYETNIEPFGMNGLVVQRNTIIKCREVAVHSDNKKGIGYPMDEFARVFPNDAWMVSFPAIYRIIEKHRMCARITASMGDDEAIDDMDHILWAFYDLYQFIDMKFFDGKFRPSDSVLPIRKFDDETIQERDERLERQFEGCPMYEDTECGKYMPTYDEIEHDIDEGWSWQG